MTYEESIENINLAITELEAIKKNLNRDSISSKEIFLRFEKACEIFKCVGKIEDIGLTENKLDGYYDSSNGLLKNYFAFGGDKLSHNGVSNLTNFFLKQRGTSEQFAIALSLVFAGDENIRCYPIRIKLKLKNNELSAESYTYANFVQIIDDDGILLNSYFVDIFNNLKPTIEYTKLINNIINMLTNENQICTCGEIEAMNIYNSDIDIVKNLKIFEHLTCDGGVNFNFDGYNFDITNAAVENCINLDNYVSKKEYKEHLDNYIQ